MSSSSSSTVHKLALTYFTSPPGRGHAIREALAIGKIPFDDIRLERSVFATQKAAGAFPFGSVPVLDVDGVRLCESNAILRFVGKLAHLYPTDPLLALRVDEIMDVVESIAGIFKPTRTLPDAERESARRKLIADGGAMHKGFALLARRQAANAAVSPRFLVGDALTVADLKLLGWRRTLATGHYDGIPLDWLDTAFPSLGTALQAAEKEVEQRKL